MREARRAARTPPRRAPRLRARRRGVGRGWGPAAKRIAARVVALTRSQPAAAEGHAAARRALLAVGAVFADESDPTDSDHGLVAFARPATPRSRPPRRGRRSVGVRVRARVRSRRISARARPRRRHGPARRRASRRKRRTAPAFVSRRRDFVSRRRDFVSSPPSLRPRRTHVGDACLVSRRRHDSAPRRRVRRHARVRGIPIGPIGRVRQRRRGYAPATGFRARISRADDVSQTFVRRHGGDRRRVSDGVRRFESRVRGGDVRIRRFVSRVGGGWRASTRARDAASARATDGADFPVTFSGLSSCGDVAPLRAWVRSTCAAASGFTVSVTVSRTPRESDDAENRGARKKLSDCLGVPPAARTGVPARSRVGPETEHVPGAAERRRARRRPHARRRTDRNTHGRGNRRAAGATCRRPGGARSV